ncbi:hypothetical protein D3C87_1737450 [compost metagenome]
MRIILTAHVFGTNPVLFRRWHRQYGGDIEDTVRSFGRILPDDPVDLPIVGLAFPCEVERRNRPEDDAGFRLTPFDPADDAIQVTKQFVRRPAADIEIIDAEDNDNLIALRRFIQPALPRRSVIGSRPA